jgi:hypothetical protein
VKPHLRFEPTAAGVPLAVPSSLGEITAPLNTGVLDRVEDGRANFPFDAVKVEFLLHAA